MTPGTPEDSNDPFAVGGVAQGRDGPDAQREALQRVKRLTELSLEQLWLRFFAIGGTVGILEVDAYLSGLMELPALQRDMLAHAANERLDEVRRESRVPYGRVAASMREQSGELEALLALLDGAHHASPDTFPALVVAAARLLDVDVVIYLADHDQRLLVPVTSTLDASGGVPQRQPLGIDSTLAGRAFARVQTVASEIDENPRLWMPLLDGAERLGVLDVQLASAADLVDPELRQHCWHFARLLGHLLVAVSRQGDGLDAIRRRKPRTVAAELVWQLLPPPTGGTDVVTLSGWIEPADSVGGDTFDYALSHDTVTLAVFDAMGHGLPAGLMAAAAVGAYRSARRNGHGLLAQARLVDETISSLSPDGTFVTGFLGVLNVSSGRLRYLCAGHPQPLLLRDGKVVRSLAGGRRMPFGLNVLDNLRGAAAFGEENAGEKANEGEKENVGEEDLQPGDCLVVYTDGVVEARDATGTFFGEDRLRDFLERAASAGQPLPETARRLSQAVLQHQDGQLQDDATVLLGSWLRP